jgi:hypothetical protein
MEKGLPTPSVLSDLYRKELSAAFFLDRSTRNKEENRDVEASVFEAYLGIGK